MNLFENPSRANWNEIINRPALQRSNLETIVKYILDDVKDYGDAAVKKYAAKYDNVQLEDIKVSESEFEESKNMIADDLKEAIAVAKKNIETFHQSQIELSQKVETTLGVHCWRKSVAIQQVGLYIPGGTAPLFSTLLMLGIPAVIAGCKEIIVCTPCDKNGQVNPIVLYVADLLGLKNMYKIGGVQAIAAMAFGTQSVPKVSKLFGPGNQYVTCAKQILHREGFAIDMLAGPSELAVYADETANPAFVAADLLSQAEHGADSQVILIANSPLLIQKVQVEIKLQLQHLSRKDIIKQALQNSRLVMLKNTDDAFDLLNLYAPEHLVIASDHANELAEKVINAGSVFLGHYAPEAAGDYASGTNHALPTNGQATVFSGVSVDSFVKKISFQSITKEGIKNIANAVELMAAAEGLDAHKNAITMRLR